MTGMRAAGFTLMELLITLLVAAVLFRLAAPAFSDVVAAQRSALALNQLISAVHFARSAAITRQATITLCPGADAVCLGRDQWHHGALVFVDHNRNGRLDPDDRILSRLPPLSADGRVYWRSFRNRAYLQFGPRGYTAWQNGNFLYCPANGNPRHARMVILNAQGRIRPARDSNRDGIMEDASGRPLNCPS
jgi:type IV fimbrial biogenesis protein FimT